jgi:PAS domain S-box-containing protein
MLSLPARLSLESLTANAEAQTPQRELIARLRESEERFRTMADCAPVLLWMAEPDARCSFFNQVWLEFTGRPLEAEVGNGWAEGVHFEDFQRCMDIFLSAFVEHRPFRMEYRLRRADGAYRWLLDTGVPRFMPDGRFAGYIGSCIDITEIRDAHDALRTVNEELERRVEQRTAELRHTNEELEQFAYAASHDLQAPLRSISAYTALIRKRYGASLDPEAQDLFGFVVQGAQHMHQLIQDLLAYSRAGRSATDAVRVDCNELLDQVLADLATAMADSGVKIVRETLPTVSGDPAPLLQLFQNLIGNAIKFRGERTPEIRIRADLREKEWVFSVSDNGIGIPIEHRERIFKVFQRLHTQEQFPGTGIGLAICKRVVERHGGRIWVESNPGSGTTFLFSLPASPDESG